MERLAVCNVCACSGGVRGSRILPERSSRETPCRAEGRPPQNLKWSIRDFGFQDLLRRVGLGTRRGRSDPRWAAALSYLGRHFETPLRAELRGAPCTPR